MDFCDAAGTPFPMTCVLVVHHDEISDGEVTIDRSPLLSSCYGLQERTTPNELEQVDHLLNVTVVLSG